MLLGVFGAISWLRTRKRFDGQLMLTYFLLAGSVRFISEFFRHPGDYRGPILAAQIPLTQAVALGIALAGGVLLWWFWRKTPQT
jgi:prolipoprotein diacylglyceryltransferase